MNNANTSSLAEPPKFDLDTYISNYTGELTLVRSQAPF